LHIDVTRHIQFSFKESGEKIMLINQPNMLEHTMAFIHLFVEHLVRVIN
jgi:hypothetical protein